jgi:hypothetical protein
MAKQLRRLPAELQQDILGRIAQQQAVEGMKLICTGIAAPSVNLAIEAAFMVAHQCSHSASLTSFMHAAEIPVVVEHKRRMKWRLVARATTDQLAHVKQLQRRSSWTDDYYAAVEACEVLQNQEQELWHEVIECNMLVDSDSARWPCQADLRWRQREYLVLMRML